jgi:hypothetical protein
MILKLTSLPDPGANPTVDVMVLPDGGCQANASAGANSNIANNFFM